ncbi:MAG: DUF1573 domain-containing protein [Phocaeicola sp.]|uniref:DUF1573 domain-containing protein n=1 Tax=Phocaeicola sp. TaxID=2773926 RepID=UPI003F9F2AB3
MREKHIIYLLILSAVLTIPTFAQPAVKVDSPDQVLGVILWKTPTVVSYRITNTGNKPLVINKVKASCACTVAEWSKNSIDPKKFTDIRVTYDAKMLGHFDKSVALYTNADEDPLYLSFRGQVSTELIEDTSNFENQIGFLRLDHTSIEFDDVNKGDKPTVKIKVMNGSDDTYTPVLMHLPPYLSAVVVPERIDKNHVGEILVTLNSDELPKLGLTTANVYLSRFSGDVVSEENEIPVSVVNLPDFSHISMEEQQNPPVISLSKKELDFGTIHVDETKKGEVIITNTGKSKLEIQYLQVFNSALGVQLKKRVIAPGKRQKLKITVYGNHLRRIKNVPRVLMITNDPKQPKIVIKVKVSLNK